MRVTVVSHDCLAFAEGKESEHVPQEKGPDKAFSHSDDCKVWPPIPALEIPWNEIRAGYSEARCVCGVEGWHAPDAERARRDPRDPSTFHHAGECEHRDTSDPALLRAILKVRDGAGGYWRVECGTCVTGWQVPHYAESVG
jgi:hypothetical protein